MKRLLPLLAIAVLFILSGDATAQTATCQNLTVQLDGTGNYSMAIGSTVPQVDAEQLIQAGSVTNTTLWQSFTATESGILHSISVNFTSPYSPPPNIYLGIHPGEGTGAFSIYAATYATSFSGMTEIVLNTSREVIAGNTYTLVLGSSGIPFSLAKNDLNPYPNGRSSFNATSDLVFSTKIIQRPDIDDGSMAYASGLASFGVDISSFTCANIGSNTVTLTVTENNSTSTTCTSTVTVQDNENPVAVCQNISVALDGTGNASITAAAINNGSSDNCSITLSASPTAFTCANVGANTVTLTVEDPTGNTDDCTATVTVTETTPPNAICQNHTLVLNGAGSATLTVANVNNGSTDNCGIATRTISKSGFTCGDLGVNTVVLTVTDVNSNQSTCNSIVTVQDNQNPAIVCPANIVICSTDNSGSVVSYIEPNGTDNCSSTTGQTDGTGLTNGSLFPIGTTVQTWTVTDIAANATSCSFNVKVNATPIPNFSFAAACQGEGVNFSDESTIDPSSSIVSWSWNMGDGSGPITLVDPIHQYADTGMYSVTLTVESLEGCTDQITQTVHVTAVPSASFTFVSACEDIATVFTNTSTIDAGNLNYVWNFGDGNTSTDASPSHVYTVDGTYTVTLTVSSDGGCEDVTSASVEVYAAPTALFTATTACEGSSTVFTNLSSDDGPLTYTWDFGDLTASVTPAPTHIYSSSGVYNVMLVATNGNGCASGFSSNVTVNALPTVGFTFSDVCEGTPASFVNTSAPGNSNWDFGDVTISTLTNVTHTYSPFGFYDVTLTITDANQCVNALTQQIEIFDLPNFSLAPTDVLCYGEATGELIAVAVPPAASPWSLSIDGGTPQNSITFGGLTAGTYDITAFDANGCQFTVTGSVSQPSDTLGITLNNLVNIVCHGTNAGTIAVAATGGTSPYTYSVDGNSPQPFGTFNGLDAGTHDIQIIDFNLCVFDTTITLTEPDTLVLALSGLNDLLCNGDNSGSLTVSATGGVAPYEYKLNTGAYGPSATFTGLAAATYLIKVRDANGCTDTLHVTLSEPGILMLSLIDSEDALCNGAANASIQTSAAAGTAPYQYSLDGVSYQGGGTFQGLTAGTYTVIVRDANGCFDEVTETVFEPSLLTIETNSTPVTCFGDQDGTIQILASGGTTAYQYSINGGNTFGASGTFGNLTGANYLTVVRDANGCTASEGVIISAPSSAFNVTASVANVLCLGDASGIVTLIGTGGTPTYTYSSDNSVFVSSNIFGGFQQGGFTLYAQDLNGCSDDVQFFVDQPATAVNIINMIEANPACPNQASGAVTVQAAGGTPGYTYSSNGGLTFQSSPILSAIGGGNHLITVKDANGCLDTDTATLVSPPIFDIVIDTIVNIDCEGDFDGEIHLTATGGTPSYSYRLNQGNLQTNGDWINLTDNTYTITIMDVNGCTYSEQVDVLATELQPVASFNFTVSNNAVLFQNASSFGDSYLWEFGDGSTSTDESPVHVYSQLGVYQVTLTVTNACGSQSVTITVNTINTGIATAETNAFSLYPNPASTELYLQSSLAMDEKVQLDIVSISGQPIRSTQITGIQANNRTQINVNGLAQGVYYLRVVSGQQQSVLRFDIIK
ncbi:MAG: PKD domain-containing protein [Flavobacteriales bacterium]|nr:PKD domain-containing protein [Flavobacteriales bacterium]